MNTATLVRPLQDWDTDAALYRLDPPLGVNGDRITHVVVSTIHSTDGDKGSLVFPAAPDGSVTSWSDLARTDQDNHAAALALIGYQVRPT